MIKNIFKNIFENDFKEERKNAIKKSLPETKLFINPKDGFKIINFNKIFGLGLLNHGFRTPSSIFYLNSLFYFPFIKYFLLNAGAIYLLGFSNFILYHRRIFFLQKGSLLGLPCFFP